jgi:primosomal protein N' (replication factor Y)
MFYEVLPAKVFKKSPNLEDGILTYSFSEKLAVGTIVEVPLGNKTTIGVVYKKVNTPNGDFKIKEITRPLFGQPLPKHFLNAIIWLSKYYLVSLPQVVSLFLPNTLEKHHKIAKNSEKSEKVTLNSEKIPLNAAQKHALEAIRATKTNTKLLHGITGSGKTNLYLTLAMAEFAENRSTILLVPEIALTSQLVSVFKETFGDNIVLIHSKQTDKTRRDTFEKLLTSTGPKIVVGPRSALFAPLDNLGLIIIDEAHESTYFQDQSPKYSALRLASFIAKSKDISCVLGTATPKVEDYYLAKERNSLVTLKEKAKETAIKPEVKVIDFKDRASFSKNRYFSDQLLEKIEENLKNGRQTLIYHNRRGSAPLTICENCGFEALCPNCFLPLTLHSDSYKLICHTCGYKEKVPISCPECKHPEIIHKGFGTKLLESELKRLFKNAKIARFDGDTDKSETLDNLYNDVKNGKIDIIIGTQTVAKGLDLPNLATVGIVQADSGLSLPDYSSEERTFDLITQVLGRVGRGHIKEANAFIQTFHPESPVIKTAIDSDYELFYEYLIKKRQKSHLPPFYYLAKISVVYKTEKTALLKIKEVYKALKNQKNIYLSAPTPAFHERLSTGYNWQIIVKSANRSALTDAIRSLETFPDLRISIDPPSLL